MNPLTPRPASLWRRFWSPTPLLEAVPPSASADEAAAVRRRNDVWLKTYMDMYILRWGVLWAATLVAAVLAADDAVPTALFVVALIAATVAFIGLCAMVGVYQRASKALRQKG